MTAQTKNRNRTQKRAKITRKKLKKAALDVFSEKPIDAATVEEITEKADVGKGTLYQHFSDKEEIVVVLVEDSLDHLIARIHNCQEDVDTLEELLERILDAHYRFSVDSREEFLLLFQGKLMLKLQSDTLDELEEPYLNYLKEIEEQIAKFLPPKVDAQRVRRLACAMAGFVFGFLSFATIGMTEDQVEKSFKPVRTVFVRSLCAFLSRKQ